MPITPNELAALAAKSSEHRAALHMLMTPPLAEGGVLDARVARHIYSAERAARLGTAPGIFFAEMLADGTFSHGERRLIACAASLYGATVYNDRGELKPRAMVDLSELAGNLSAKQLDRFVEALRMRNDYHGRMQRETFMEKLIDAAQRRTG